MKYIANCMLKYKQFKYTYSNIRLPSVYITFILRCHRNVLRKFSLGYVSTGHDYQYFIKKD